MQIEHEYLRNVLLHANVGIARDDYNQNGGNQTLWATGAGATYLLNRNMQLGLAYDFVARQSSGNAGNGNTLVITTPTLVSSGGAFGSTGAGSTGAASAASLTQNLGGNYTDHRIMLQLRLAL